MGINIFDFEVSHRIANEIQLLNEKQWLMEALRKLQTQRNSLQIEKLHLESLKSRILCNKPSEASETNEELPPVNLMQQIPSSMKPDGPTVKDDEICNGEELNLSVRNLHALQSVRDLEMEEYEDEDTEDDDYNIDMNMFMNGDHNTTDK